MDGEEGEEREGAEEGEKGEWRRGTVLPSISSHIGWASSDDRLSSAPPPLRLAWLRWLSHAHRRLAEATYLSLRFSRVKRLLLARGLLALHRNLAKMKVVSKLDSLGWEGGRGRRLSQGFEGLGAHALRAVELFHAKQRGWCIRASGVMCRWLGWCGWCEVRRAGANARIVERRMWRAMGRWMEQQGLERGREVVICAHRVVLSGRELSHAMARWREHTARKLELPRGSDGEWAKRRRRGELARGWEAFRTTRRAGALARLLKWRVRGGFGWWVDEASIARKQVRGRSDEGRRRCTMALRVLRLAADEKRGREQALGVAQWCYCTRLLRRRVFDPSIPPACSPTHLLQDSKTCTIHLSLPHHHLPFPHALLFFQTTADSPQLLSVAFQTCLSLV